MSASAVALLGADLTNSLTFIACSELVQAFDGVLTVSELLIGSFLLSVGVAGTLQALTEFETRTQKRAAAGGPGASASIVWLRWVDVLRRATATVQLLLAGVNVQLSLVLTRASVTIPVARVLTIFSAILVNVFLVSSAQIGSQELAGRAVRRD